MIVFFKKNLSEVIAVETDHTFTPLETEKLTWLFGGARALASTRVKGSFIGPRKEMITPWSTNAVEITQSMGIKGITRIELFRKGNAESKGFDPMLERVYTGGLNSRVFTTSRKPEPIVEISDIRVYNRECGLALSPDEEEYLDNLARRLGRRLTDSEVFGFSQVNSEHCRHKIFNGTFIIDGKEMPRSLFALIKRTSKLNGENLVSAYKDNVAFVKGPDITLFYPEDPSRPGMFTVKTLPSVLSLKAETHNFPTTVEPFNGAATGTGGEIRDRLGGGRASLPLAGTAVYMTSYPRLTPGLPWEQAVKERRWLYQTPSDILIKASNGASDFGNKFGQPLICGSLLTFEHTDKEGRTLAYDKVIMLAGGIGFAAADQAVKGTPAPGEKVVVMGGDNYRIGMGGGAVSSVDTGIYDNAIELNAVQRANPEMQKRVSNVIRALAESDSNPIVSIHDHGAGGHLNALSELVEATGGIIDIDALPVGDLTLSDKEIVGNESQERMGMVVEEKDIQLLRDIADRERAPMFVVGETTDDERFVFEHGNSVRPIDLSLADMFGNSPKTVITDTTVKHDYPAPALSEGNVHGYLENVLSLEAVACKDWLTNKVDRSVTGKIARQQCQGEIQLPLSDCGVAALDYNGKSGMATSIGHAPQAALADAPKGSVLAIAESLTNIVGAPLKDGLKSISLSANWMWPCKNPGEDAALYSAVQSASDFACALGINIPTGKDSLSMTQKYADTKVLAPGTVIISAAGEVSDIRRVASPVMLNRKSTFYYIDFSGSPLALGGSALLQTLGAVGNDVPAVADAAKFAAAFNAVQKLVKRGSIAALHDVSAGGLITTLLEMAFANTKGGIEIDTAAFAGIGENSLLNILFAENPAVVLQIESGKTASAERLLDKEGVRYLAIGHNCDSRYIKVNHAGKELSFDINALRDVWYAPSATLDALQSGEKCASLRAANYKRQPLRQRLPQDFVSTLTSRGIAHGLHKPSGIKAAIIREKGINGDREMAYSLYLAGFDVRDVHMTDLTSGRETLDDINMLVFCGGFSNSDVLGSAKGWAGAFLWNEKAKETLRRFYSRPDTLSLGVCNGCQLMMELNLICPEHSRKATMEHNISHKFESEFIDVVIPESNSVMLGSLAGSRLGIWVAHGEGRFNLPMPMENYNVALKYAYSAYPGNPNGSRAAVAGLCSADGRHLAMMPHLERAIFPWQCGFYPESHRADDVTPWIDAFINARKWIEKNKK